MRIPERLLRRTINLPALFPTLQHALPVQVERAGYQLLASRRPTKSAAMAGCEVFHELLNAGMRLVQFLDRSYRESCLSRRLIIEIMVAAVSA